MTSGALEQRITVGDMEFAVKIWGDSTGEPVLATHGWLDNAASFDVLAPLLSQCRIVAVDLAGHGHSSHRPASGSYLIWSDLLELLAIADYLGWQRFSVLGHSRGAIIATLLTIAAPKRVRRLVAMDNMLPPPSPAADSASNLRQFVQDERRYQAKKAQPQKPFESLDIAINARQQVMPIETESARLIVERGTKAVPGGFVWRHDERLKGRSAFKLTAEHNEALYAELQADTLFIGSQAYLKYRQQFGQDLSSNARVQQLSVEGNHHFHMEAPAANLAPVVESFLINGRQ